MPPLLTATLAGVAAGLVASAVMEAYQNLASPLFGQKSEGDPATVKAADDAKAAVGQPPVTQKHRMLAGRAVHYATGLALGIDGKDHRGDVLLAVMGGSLGDGRRMRPRSAEVFRHRALQLVVTVVGVATARLFGVGVDVDGADLGEIDHVFSPQTRINAGSSLS